MKTAQDIVGYLLAATGGGAQDGEHHAVRQAVIHGVREVLQCRDWLWHTKTGRFETQVSQTTATITNGSPNITVANASQIAPGRLISIAPIYFSTTPRVASVAGNVVTMDRPAILSGTNVPITPQTYYDLPSDLKDIDALVTNTVGTLHCYISPQEWQRLEINTRGAGEPYYYTIMRSDNDPDRWQIRFVGVPTNGTPVNFTYRYRPREIRYTGYEKVCRVGRVSSTLYGYLVTGTDTEFPENITGSVLRFGTTAEDPDPVGGTFPFQHERYIAARASATQLSISNAPAATNVRYCITDPIDASPTMYTAIISACEMWYARLAGKPANDAINIFNRDLRIAMENDVLSPRSGRAINSPYPTPRSRGWHSDLMPDIV